MRHERVKRRLHLGCGESLGGKLVLPRRAQPRRQDDNHKCDQPPRGKDRK